MDSLGNGKRGRNSIRCGCETRRRNGRFFGQSGRRLFTTRLHRVPLILALHTLTPSARAVDRFGRRCRTGGRSSGSGDGTGRLLVVEDAL